MSDRLKKTASGVAYLNSIHRHIKGSLHMIKDLESERLKLDLMLETWNGLQPESRTAFLEAIRDE